MKAEIGLAAVLAMATAAGQEMKIQPGAATRVEAIVEKTGLYSGKKHTLVWDKFDGKFSVTPPKVELTVEAASVQVTDDWLSDSRKKDVKDETLGKNVLDTGKHPQIKFVSTGVTGDTATGFQVAGNLTVRGITKPVTLTVKRNGARYEGQTVFPMSGFGIKPPRAALGAIGTKDEMTIQFVVAASQ